MSQADESLYIRVRGKAQGPFSSEQLQALAQRGQFSRMHEVSRDGVSWARASTYPHLFPNPVTVIGGGHPSAAEAREYELASNRSAATAAPAFKSSQKKWYYTAAGAECGPVDFAALQSLLAGGQLGASDVVWSEGMADWAPPGTVPGLLGTAGNAGSIASDIRQASKDLLGGLFPAAEGGRSDTLSTEACRAIAGSRPWMLFIAITMYFAAVLSVGVGVVWIIKYGGVPGLFEIIHGILVGMLATVLVNSFNRLGDVLYTKSPSDLEKALHAVRRFWFFLGVVVIVYLSFSAVLLLILLQAGATLNQLAPMWAH